MQEGIKGESDKSQPGVPAFDVKKSALGQVVAVEVACGYAESGGAWEGTTVKKGSSRLGRRKQGCMNFGESATSLTSIEAITEDVSA